MKSPRKKAPVVVTRMRLIGFVASLAILVAGYTLMDFVRSVSGLQWRVPAQEGGDVRSSAPPSQFVDVVALPNASAEPEIITPVSGAAGLQAAEVPAEEPAIDPPADIDTAQETAPEAYRTSVQTSPWEIAGAVSQAQVSLFNAVPQVRKTGAYALLEMALTTGDPDGTMRSLLRGAVNDPDPEIADFARHALMQVPGGVE